MKKHRENIIWAAVLITLFIWTPNESGQSLCMFKFLGFSSCWGCGIGHSMHYALHLNFAESWEHHVAGIPATGILVYKILNNFFKSSHKNYQTWTHKNI